MASKTPDGENRGDQPEGGDEERHAGEATMENNNEDQEGDEEKNDSGSKQVSMQGMDESTAIMSAINEKGAEVDVSEMTGKHAEDDSS